MRLLFLLSSLALCFISFSQKNQYPSTSLDENLTANANAIVRLDEMQIDLASINAMTTQRKKVITVLNEKGNDYAMAFVNYDDNRRIKDLYMNVYDASGSVVEKYKKRDFKDASAVDGSTLYSDSKVKYHPYTPVSYPYTVELFYSTSTSNTGEIRSVWPFSTDFMVSTEKSRLVINYNTLDLKPEIKEKNIDEFSVSKKTTDGSMVYEATNIGAMKKESLSPSFGQLAPQVLIRPVHFKYEGFEAKINSWNDLGAWMFSNIIKGRDELPSSTISIVKNLVKDTTDDLEKAKIIYQYVQDNTRYISVQVGIGGIQPISALEVDRVKYGDCKGLSNYTMSLLKAVGVEAYYVHVEAGSEKVNFEDDFPNLAQGNHVILAIPYNNTYYWLDSTSQITPFGFIGNFTDDRKVLVIKPNGGEIVSTKAYLNEDNYQKTKASYRLNSDGSIAGEAEILSKGSQYNQKYILDTADDDDIRRFYKNYWGNINNLKIGNYDFTNRTESVEFVETISISARDYSSQSGGRILFVPNLFNKYNNVPPRYRNRKLSFIIRRGFFDEDDYSIEIPEGYQIESIPEKVELDSKFGSYTLAMKQVDQKIELSRKLKIKSGTYSKDDYQAYRNLIKQIVKSDALKIVLKSNQ